MIDAIGWASSFVLVLTIGQQVFKQWKEGSSEGVSRWLFVGQVAASTGFVVYSALVKNWVFVVTNAFILASAIAGAFIMLMHRRGRWRAKNA
jgi:uncharacterized protein with PQ loop repeat